MVGSLRWYARIVGYASGQVVFFLKKNLPHPRLLIYICVLVVVHALESCIIFNLFNIISIEKVNLSCHVLPPRILQILSLKTKQ